MKPITLRQVLCANDSNFETQLETALYEIQNECGESFVFCKDETGHVLYLKNDAGLTANIRAHLKLYGYYYF